MSGLVPGTVANDDSPKRRGSNRNAPIHTNDALIEFIKQHLIEDHFCVKTSTRNDDVAKRLVSPSSKPPARKHQEMPSVPPIESAWKTLKSVLNSKSEKSAIYRPLCRFLTLLANKKFLFIPWDHKTAGEQDLLDIITVNARPEEIDCFLNANQKLDKLPSEFTYQEGNKLKPRIYYSDIQLVGEIKTGDAPDSPFNDAVQVLKYLFTVSRYQPQHAYHIGILVYSDGFFIIDYYPDKAFFSKLFKWADKDVAWEALRSAFASLRERPFTTAQFALIKPSDDQRSSRLQYRDFNASDAKVYRLFDLHRGYGYHRNAYVGLGVRSDVNEELDLHDWRVIKHYWHDMERRFDELEIFKKIYSQSKTKRCTAGIVRVDLNESKQLGEDETPAVDEKPVKRRSVSIIMKTLGKALATCSSVMKFLKVMYDLVEVHRMLVEEHDILHRDISWTNVLIDAIHVDGDKHDDLCERPFIDAILGVEEKARKVHATLSDFDCGYILGSERKRESDTRGEITGTPMFISRQLCLFPPALKTLHRDFRQACKSVFPLGVTGVNQRQEEVAVFLQVVDQLDIVQSVDDVDISPRKSMAHQPMHDAESIFWLIVLFFLRAWPKGYDPKTDPEEPSRRKLRTDTLESLARNKIGTTQDIRGFLAEYILPPQLLSFSDMLARLDNYFLQGWHRLGIREGQHRFHAHNALQSVLLQEIKKLQARNTEIEINTTPLGVNDNPVLIPKSQSYIGAKRSAPDDAITRLPVKKQKVAHETNSAVGKVEIKLEATSSDGHALAPLTSALDGCRRSKLWFTGDEDYKEHAFVEAGHVPGLIRT